MADIKVLLTGAAGQLGTSLQKRRPSNWALTALNSAQLDVTDPQAVQKVIEAVRPEVIINAAAYNAVDLAEHEPGRAFAVNAHGPLNLAKAANAVGARLVHVSTDYVFDGEANRPYTELAPTNPVNVYGQSKLQGERWVLETQPNALIIRTAWVYGEYSNNFVRTILKAADRAKALMVVDDQTGASTYVGDLADAIIALIHHPLAQPGLYHYTGATALTRFDFAQAILEAADRLNAEKRAVLLKPVSSEAYGSAALRPNYSVLDCSKMANLGIAPQPVEKNLSRVVKALIASDAAGS